MSEYLISCPHCGVLIARIKAAQDPEVMAPAIDDILDRPITEMEIGSRAYSCMVNQGIDTFRDLIHRTKKDLLKERNFGKVSLREIEKCLAARGLHLRGERK